MQNNMKLSALAYGKINLYLDVLSRMENGYHNIESVMQSVSLFDEICLEISDTQEKNQIEIKSFGGIIPNDKTNLVYKAAVSFFEKANINNKKCVFTIKKNIPVAAGMAGGSSDGATALRLLNEAFGQPFSLDTLCEIGSKIGADFPFCLVGGTSICEGIGERLIPLPKLNGIFLVCAIDNSSVSTPIAFGMLDEKYGTNPLPYGGLEKIKKAIIEGNINDLASSLYNKFEGVIIPQNPNVEKIKATLIENGAIGALMSGSGPSVFGIFDNEISQINAYNALKNCSIRAFLCKTI